MVFDDVRDSGTLLFYCSTILSKENLYSNLNHNICIPVTRKEKVQRRAYLLPLSTFLEVVSAVSVTSQNIVILSIQIQGKPGNIVFCLGS